MTGKEYFQLKEDLKEYDTQAGKRSWIYGMDLTNQQKAQLDARYVAGGDEQRVDNTIVRTRTQKDDGTWNDWEVKADYGSEDLFTLSQLGSTRYDNGTYAMSKGADIKNVLKLYDAMEAKGRAYGVAKTPFKASSWNCWGIPDLFASELKTPVATPQETEYKVRIKGGSVHVRDTGSTKGRFQPTHPVRGATCQRC